MKILFVCTGNTCRSPLAEAIARKIAIERGLHDVDAMSAGTSAHDGSPASDGALLVGIERNMDLNDHRSQTLSRDLVARGGSHSRDGTAPPRAHRGTRRLGTRVSALGLRVARRVDARDQRSDRRRARRLSRDGRRARGRDSPRARSDHGGAGSRARE